MKLQSWLRYAYVTLLSRTNANIGDKRSDTSLVELTVGRTFLANGIDELQRLLVNALAKNPVRNDIRFRRVFRDIFLLQSYQRNSAFPRERNVRLFARLHQENRLALLSRSRGTTAAMNEEGWVLRRGVLDDPVHVRDIDAARSDVRADENGS